jgi:hypothetical protein
LRFAFLKIELPAVERHRRSTSRSDRLVFHNANLLVQERQPRTNDGEQGVQEREHEFCVVFFSVRSEGGLSGSS